MCVAWAGRGVSVALVAPRRRNPISEDFFSYFGVPRSFSFSVVSSPDFYAPGILDGVVVAVKSFLASLRLSFFALRYSADIFYSRDELVVYWLSFFKKKVFWEAHTYSPKRRLLYQRFIKRSVGVVAISQ